MGEPPREVKLYGTAYSGFAKLVDNALKLKGVAFEYIIEDLQNKSEALLRLNPVYKKVPVLVVDGKPIAESLVILQYIDESWSTPPRLLPEEPYRRAKTRFWADFVYQKLVPLTYAVRLAEDEAKRAVAAEEFRVNLIAMENGIREELWGGGPFIGGGDPGLVDVIMGGCYAAIKNLEGVTGVTLLEMEKMPLMCSAMEAFVALDVIKE